MRVEQFNCVRVLLENTSHSGGDRAKQRSPTHDGAFEKRPLLNKPDNDNDDDDHSSLLCQRSVLTPVFIMVEARHDDDARQWTHRTTKKRCR